MHAGANSYAILLFNWVKILHTLPAYNFYSWKSERMIQYYLIWETIITADD